MPGIRPSGTVGAVSGELTAAIEPNPSILSTAPGCKWNGKSNNELPQFSLVADKSDLFPARADDLC